MNLRFKHRPLLINNLTVADFGYYQTTDPDNGSNVAHLVIKKIGLDLVSHGMEDPTVTVSKTQVGALKSVLLDIVAPEPASLINYDYGIDIVKKVKDPGVLNDDWVKKSRFYGGNIAALQTCSGGELADEDKVTIEDDIITQIHVDRGGGTREESIVDAKRLYIITVANDGDESVTFNYSDDTSATVVLTAAMDTTIDAINKDATNIAQGIMAFALSTTTIAITSVSQGTLFTVVDGNDGTTIVVSGRYIWVYSRDVNNQFEVKWDRSFITLTRFNVAILQTTSAVAGNLVMYHNGLSHTAAAAADSGTFAVNINAQISAHGGYASGLLHATNYSPVYVYTGIYEAKFPTLGTAGLSITTQYSGGGIYPNLTWEDVFREFAEMKHLDGLAHIVSTSMPAAGDKYNKVTITAGVPHANMHGASQIDIQAITYHIYIKQGYGTTHLWDSDNYMWESTTDDAGFVADSDINDLLATWIDGSSPGIV